MRNVGVPNDSVNTTDEHMTNPSKFTADQCSVLTGNNISNVNCFNVRFVKNVEMTRYIDTLYLFF